MKNYLGIKKCIKLYWISVIYQNEISIKIINICRYLRNLEHNSNIIKYNISVNIYLTVPIHLKNNI